MTGTSEFVPTPALFQAAMRSAADLEQTPALARPVRHSHARTAAVTVVMGLLFVLAAAVSLYLLTHHGHVAGSAAYLYNGARPAYLYNG